MSTLVPFVLLTVVFLCQVTDTAARVAKLEQAITPVPPNRIGRGFEYLHYQSRMNVNRYEAMVELGTLGKDAASAVPLLSKLINDPYEPLRYRIAMIDTLQKIGPASKAALPSLKQVMASKNGEGQQSDPKEFLLSIAAERAILFLEPKPEEQAYKTLLNDLYPLFHTLSESDSAQTIKAVHAYYRHRNSLPSEQIARQFASIQNESQKRLNLVVQLLGNRASRDLGSTLLNSSFIDGKSIVNQLLVSSSWPYACEICLRNLDGRDAFAQEILEDPATKAGVWERVFAIYKEAIINEPATSKQERLSEVIPWLRRISNRPGRQYEAATDWLFETDMMMFQNGEPQQSLVETANWMRQLAHWTEHRRQIAFDWLFNTWETSGSSNIVRREIVETAKRLVDSIAPSDGLLLLRNWQSRTDSKMHFIAQLLPDSRVSKIDREEAAQQLIASTTSRVFDPASVERMLISLIRLKPTPAPSFRPPLVDQYLNDGRFAEGEVALQLVLDANPEEAEARFSLGVLQVARAVEDLGKALYKYGAVSENTTIPLLRLPVPRNDSPSTISYEEFGAMLDAFTANLGKAEATLAMVRGDDVKLQLRLAKISFDFTGTGKDRKTMLEILSKLNGGRPIFTIANPEFRVHFDRGDVAWLRAYCHLISALVDSYRAMDHESVFPLTVTGLFPKVKTPHSHADHHPNTNLATLDLRVGDVPRLRSARLHLLSVCELNKETWFHIRNEVDDDYEWLADTDQMDPLFLPLTENAISSWLVAMKQLEGLLKGELLIPGTWLMIFTPLKIQEDRGLNLQKLLDDPPVEWIIQGQLFGSSLDDKYLGPLTNENAIGADAFLRIFQMIQSPYGYAQAARLN